MQMLLCAQRKEYSKVKRRRFWFLFVSVIVVAGLTIWVAITDNSKVDSVLTVLNVGIIFLRERIMRIFEKKQEFAAQIQQYFDSSCYNTAIEKEMIDGESLFTESKIAEIQAGVCHEDLSDFANWYSDYRSKPAEKQILYSQRENLLWDEKLRLLYRTIIIILLILVSSIIIIYGIKSSAPFEKMCALISCVLVFIECAWDSIEKITRDLRRLNKLFAQYEETEKAVCSSKIRSQKKLSDLQNEIFTHRKESFLIPDFVYRLRKESYQEITDATAKMLNSK
jgi:hypothetical protein